MIGASAALTRQCVREALTNLAYPAAGNAIMDSLMIGLAIVVGLYIALRLALRFYFPPDTL